MGNEYFKYFQPNKKDLKDNYDDCVVRSLVAVTDKNWVWVFDELCSVARDIQCMPNNKMCYEEFLKRNGFKYRGISNKKGSKRPTVLSFTKEHKQGKYVLVVANHLVSLVNGKYLDTWDSGDKSMYGYWEKEENLQKNV